MAARPNPDTEVPAPPDAGPDDGVLAERQRIAAARREAAELSDARPAIPPGTAIPGYTLLREIGRGGMGVIYEAIQKEPPRPVALKIMRGGRGVSKHRLTLFRQEVATLARLNNPMIAAIYGSGRTDDGKHYFAMELVRGEPLTACARHLPRAAQLELFRRVCEAVHYAHQRGVIHRDLKPSNILVDPDGRPKILDFGLAHIAGSEHARPAVNAASGRLVGTLPYMSPEQVRGRPEELDTRTDVYSLGVILYELLTGELPYDRDDLEREGVTRAITERPPRRPSRVNRTVRGDLELIVLKALEKDPARRYQSAAALAEDLERLATGRAVLARPPAVAYQLRKWTWRHRVACAYVGTLVALAVPAAVALSQVYAEARQMRIDEQQRKAAVARWYLQERVRARELRMAQQAQAFWEKTMADIGSNRPGISAVQLLDRAAARVGSELNDTPDTAAAVHTALADAYKRLERLPEAEGHLRAAVDRWKNAKPPDALKHAEALERLAGFLIERERWADAEQVLASELDLLAQPQRPVVGEESGPAEAERLAQASALLAQCLVPQGRFEEAEALLLRSLAELRRLYAEGDPRALRVVGLLVDLNQRWDRPEEAARWQARLQAAAPEDGPAPPP